MTDIVIVCDDLFGLEIYSLIEEINKRVMIKDRCPRYRMDGFVTVTDDPFGELRSPLPILGKLESWTPAEGVKVVLGLRSPEAKAAAVELLRGRNAQFETIKAPWMLSFSKWLTIGEGCIVAPYSAKPGMVIGDFVTIVSSMLSGHGIGDYSTVMRLSNIAGETIGKNSYVGDHVFLAVGKSIGDGCYVEDGSIVVKDVKDGVRVSGVPAKKKKEGR